MMIYRRYLAREVGFAILLVLAALIALFSFFDMIGEVKSIGKDGYQFYHAAAFVALRVPGRIYELLPVAVLIGTLYALSTLARHSEITVLRASGVSTARLLGALFQIAAVVAVLTFVIGEVVVPPCERLAQQMRLVGRGKAVGKDLSSGLWVRDERSFINVQNVMPDGRLIGIRIFDFDDRARLRSVTDASDGDYAGDSSWRLRGVVRTELRDERTEVAKLPDLIWKSALSPEILTVLMVSPDRMSMPHLLSYVKHLSENRQKTQRYEVALWRKIVYPLAALVMVALALPFGYTHDRVGGVSLKIFVGVMIGVLFHMLNGLFSNLGVINSWSPPLSAVTPSLLFMLAAVGMIGWVERR